MLLMAVWLMTGCEQPDGSVGSLVSNSENTFAKVVDLLVLVDTSYVMPSAATGGSAYLYVGSANGVSADALIRYAIPTLPYDLRVDSAKIELSYQGGIGNKAFPNIKGELLRFRWSESSACEDIPVLPFGKVEPRFEDLPGDTGEIVFPIPSRVIEDWFSLVDDLEADTTEYDSTGSGDTKFGNAVSESALTLKISHTGDANRLVQFQSRNVTVDSLKPHLYVFIEALDSAGGNWYADTLDILPSADLFRVKSEPVEIGQKLMVGSGAVIETALKFDMSPLLAAMDSSYIVINRAVLNLFIDTTSNQVFSKTPSLWPFMFDDDRWLTRPAASDETGFVITTTAIDPDENKVQVVLTYPAGVWIETPEDNHGMVLHSGGEGLNIDRITFVSSENPDVSRHPYLTVYYTEYPR